MSVPPADVAPGLIEGLERLGDEYGPRGVLETVRQMWPAAEPIGQTNFQDVGEFHRKFGLPASDIEPGPRPVSQELFEFRCKFMQEELDEFKEAWVAGDHGEMFDALLDIVYVAMGTAHIFGYPWQEGWDEVQRANMAKERATTETMGKRQSTWDVVKPEGWTAPDIESVLRRHDGRYEEAQHCEEIQRG